MLVSIRTHKAKARKLKYEVADSILVLLDTELLYTSVTNDDDIKAGPKSQIHLTPVKKTIATLHKRPCINDSVINYKSYRQIKVNTMDAKYTSKYMLIETFEEKD